MQMHRILLYFLSDIFSNLNESGQNYIQSKNNNYQNIFPKLRLMDISKFNTKKLYEIVLSVLQPSQDLLYAIQAILRTAILQSSHFQFLLHRISWFTQPYLTHIFLLQKTIRLYRGKSKEAAKVCYNLLIQALIIPSACKAAIQCLKNLIPDSYHQEIFIECLREGYPHKLCPVEMHETYLDSLIVFCKIFPEQRFDFLEIIVQNLTGFDTQLLIGDQWYNKHFPQDQKLKELRKLVSCQISQKYDILLTKFFAYIQKQNKDQVFLKQMFQVFQNKILSIKSTKMIQFSVFVLAQSDKNMSNKFISLLLTNILDINVQKQNWYRIFTQSNFYLISYLNRSNRISIAKKQRVVEVLLNYLKERIFNIQEKQSSQKLMLNDLFLQQERNLHILQTIFMIIAHQPGLKDSVQDLNLLVKQCRLKLQFQYFINDDLLTSLNICKLYKQKCQKNKKIVLKFSNKFNPPLLMKVGDLIQKVYKFKIQEFSVRKSQQTLCSRKIVKQIKKDIGQYCEGSDTGPTHH